jgi:predicted PurR-regulated permease PerM
LHVFDRDRFLQTFPSMDESVRELRAWATFAGLVLIVFVLYWTQAFVVPIALAALLAFVLTPAVTGLERRIGRVVSVLAVVALVFAFFGFIGWGLAHQFDRFAADLPEYRAHILAKLDEFRGASTSAAPDTLDKAVRDLTSKIDSQSISIGSLEVILGPVGTGVFVLIMVIFMLFERKTLRDRLLSLVGHGQLIRTTRAFEEAGTRVSRQLLLQSLVNLVYGAIIATGLSLLHVPYPFIWAGLAAVLRFIPYVGFAVAVGAPTLMSVAALPGWNGPLGVLLLFACLEGFTSVVVETNLYANAAGVSQVALLISVAFWAWLWGPLGLLMATPLTVCLVVLGKHVPGLESVGMLMTDAPALAPEDGYYQRLLARDLADASELIDRYIKASPPRGVYDALLLPALNYAARDRIDERLSLVEESAVIDGSGELLAYASDAIHHQEAPAGLRAIPASGAARLRLIGFPSSGPSAELALAMLATFLDDLPIEVNIANSRLKVSELVALIKDRQIGVVCFADLPPNSTSKTRYLVRRLRTALPDLAIVVGRWAPPVLADEVPQVLRDAGATAVVSTFAETRSFVSSLTGGPQPTSPSTSSVHAP